MQIGLPDRQPLTPLVTHSIVAHHITYAPDIFNISRLFGIILDFFSDMEYMYHDSILIVGVDHPVDCPAQLFLREGSARVSHHCVEDFILVRGYLNHFPVL